MQTSSSSREADLLFQAGSLGIADLALRNDGTLLTGAFGWGAARCALFEAAAVPGELYAWIPGALRSPFVLAPGAAGPEWFAGADIELAGWLNAHPALRELVGLSWSHGGALLPWLVQGRAHQGRSLIVLQLGDPQAGRSSLAALGTVLRALTAVVVAGPAPDQRFLGAARFESQALPLLGSQPHGAQVHGFMAASGMSHDEASRMQAAVQARVQAPVGSSSARVNQAAKLLVGKKYTEAIQAYQEVAQDFPDRAGVAASQIGAALYFLGRFDEAIAEYRRAVTLGESADMMRDNIEEAEAALRTQGRA